jgi:hypothetical protein
MANTRVSYSRQEALKESSTFHLAYERLNALSSGVNPCSTIFPLI